MPAIRTLAATSRTTRAMGLRTKRGCVNGRNHTTARGQTPNVLPPVLSVGARRCDPPDSVWSLPGSGLQNADGLGRHRLGRDRLDAEQMDRLAVMQPVACRQIPADRDDEVVAPRGEHGARPEDDR